MSEKKIKKITIIIKVRMTFMLMTVIMIYSRQTICEVVASRLIYDYYCELLWSFCP